MYVEFAPHGRSQSSRRLLDLYSRNDDKLQMSRHLFENDNGNRLLFEIMPFKNLRA